MTSDNSAPRGVSMSYPRHYRAILVLGLPLIGGHLAQFAITITDTLMMGWYSVEGLAAVTLAGTYFFLLFLFGSGFAQAVMPLVAAQFAEGDHVQIRRTTRMGLWMSILFGTLFLPLFWWSEAILGLMGQSDAIAADVQSYLRIAGWGILPALGVMVLKSYLAAMERTQVVLWVTIAAALLNALVNYALIFGNFGAPELGLRGAAIASVVVQTGTLIAIAVYARVTFPEHDLTSRIWKPDWDAFATVGRLGLPIGLTLLAEVGLFSASTVMMGWLGTIPLAAHGVALQLTSATFMIHLGLANVATVRAGNAHGRRDGPGLVQGAKAVISLSLVFALMTIVAFVVAPEPLISLFLDPAEPAREQIIVTGSILLIMAGIFQLVDAAQVIALGLLRGLQDTKRPMIYAAISYWLIGVPVSYVFGFTFGWGGAGIWGGLAVGLGVAGVLMMGRFWMQSVPDIMARSHA